MHRNLKRMALTFSAAAMTALCVAPQTAHAVTTDHVVSTGDLQKATVDAARQRQQNIASLNALLGSPKAARALEAANMDPAQVKTAVASLDDKELAQLAVRANKAQADFAAGYISDRDLLVILVAVAALILIIIAVR
jgi:hypothetical protein